MQKRQTKSGKSGKPRQGNAPQQRKAAQVRQGGQRRNDRSRRQKAKRPSSKLSFHFSKKDFSCKCGECEQGLKISLGLIGGLELLRSRVGKRIEILKGYQCPESAEKVGKVRRNFHVSGVAADIRVEGLSLGDLYREAMAIPELKGLGLVIDEDHVHVDTRKDADRKEWVEEKGVVTDLDDSNRSRYVSENADTEDPDIVMTNVAETDQDTVTNNT